MITHIYTNETYYLENVKRLAFNRKNRELCTMGCQQPLRKKGPIPRGYSKPPNKIDKQNSIRRWKIVVLSSWGLSPQVEFSLIYELSFVRFHGFLFPSSAAVLSQKFSFAPDLDALRNRGADGCQGLCIGDIL